MNNITKIRAIVSLGIIIILVILAILLITNSSKNNKTQKTTANSKQWVISISQTGFTPDKIEIKNGDIITWVVSDNSSCQITSSNNESLHSPKLNKNLNFSLIFSTSGVYPYNCIGNNQLHGLITVK